MLIHLLTLPQLGTLRAALLHQSTLTEFENEEYINACMDELRKIDDLIAHAAMYK